MKPIVEVLDLAKKYRINHLHGGYMSLRERMLSVFHFDRNSVEDFWALKNISFSVQPGESIGIIGRNGAGKSTLLKILSKITPPTKGRIVTRGRIASLLEVGTGFHPELTGRENVFFNGSLLGMKRREIQNKFDEIIDFSGVEKFLDTPLKHFSSGMQLRLAFAVAAFLEPEILIVDEVLAVGDAEFQKKCIGKMEDVSNSGRTILFVSHNMAAVKALCAKALLLSNGEIEIASSSEIAISHYLNDESHIEDYYIAKKSKSTPFISCCYTSHASDERASRFLANEDIVINIEVEGIEGSRSLSLGLALRDKWNNKIFTTVNQIIDNKKKYRVFIPSNLLLAGNFSFDVAIFIPQGTVYDYVQECLGFRVNDFESDMAIYNGADIGILNINCQWQ